MVGIIIAIVIVVIIIGLVLWLISMYNTFIKMRNNVEEAYSTMDVYLKKRYDLIPNLVSTVKGYAKHEKETLENVIKARNMAMNSKSSDEKVVNENVLSGALKTLFAVAESYPELKADSQFLNLQASLSSIENDIASSRKYYNGNVKVYNVKIEAFPSNIVAKIFKFVKKTLFEVESAEERKNVKVEF